MAEKLKRRQFGYWDGKPVDDFASRQPRKCRICGVQLQLGDDAMMGGSGNGVHFKCYQEPPKELDEVQKMAQMSEDELRRHLRSESSSDDIVDGRVIRKPDPSETEASADYHENWRGLIEQM